MALARRALSRSHGHEGFMVLAPGTAWSTRLSAVRPRGDRPRRLDALGHGVGFERYLVGRPAFLVSPSAARRASCRQAPRQSASSASAAVMTVRCAASFSSAIRRTSGAFARTTGANGRGSSDRLAERHVRSDGSNRVPSSLAFRVLGHEPGASSPGRMWRVWRRDLTGDSGRRAGAPQSPVPPFHRRQAHGLEPRGPPRA